MCAAPTGKTVLIPKHDSRLPADSAHNVARITNGLGKAVTLTQQIAGGNPLAVTVAAGGKGFLPASHVRGSAWELSVAA